MPAEHMDAKERADRVYRKWYGLDKDAAPVFPAQLALLESEIAEAERCARDKALEEAAVIAASDIRPNTAHRIRCRKSPPAPSTATEAVTAAVAKQDMTDLSIEQLKARVDALERRAEFLEMDRGLLQRLGLDVSRLETKLRNGAREMGQ